MIEDNVITIVNFRSWKIIKSLRWYGRQVRRIITLFKLTLRAI